MRTSRTGGALFPVLMITGIIFLLSSMLPQVLVQASGSLRVDHARDELTNALDSGVAFAEARLKRDLTNYVMAGVPLTSLAGAALATLADGTGADSGGLGTPLPQLAGWVVKPSFDNPDFGRKKKYAFEVRCQTVRLWKLGLDANGEIYRFTYALDAGAWREDGNKKHVEVTGTITLTTAVSRSSTGSPVRVLKGPPVINGLNRELQNDFVSAPASSPAP